MFFAFDASDTTQERLRRHWVAAVFLMIVFLASVAYYALILALGVNTDFQDHLGFLQSWVSGEFGLPGNPLFYLSVWLFSGFSADESYIAAAGVIVIALSITARCWLSARFINQDSSGPIGFGLSIGAAFVALVLNLAFSLPLDYLYIESIPPNVWHNSTTIISVPFALLLFILAIRQLESPSLQNVALMTLVCCLGVLAKPSFFMAFAPVFFVFSFLRFGLRRNFLTSCVPIFAGAAVMLVMYLDIYAVAGDALIDGGDASGVSLRSISEIGDRLFRFPLPLLASVAFPLLFVLLHPGSLTEDESLRMAWALFFVGYLIRAILTETGPRATHGNFSWGAMICNYVLFCATARLLLDQAREWPTMRWRSCLLGIVLVGHALAGLNYMAQMIIQRSYWI